MTGIDITATGINICRLRKDRNITLKEMQAAFGFSTPQAIFKWQRGECLPTIDNFVILADMLGTTIDAIIIKNHTAA